MVLLLINEYSNYRRSIITTLTYVDKNRGSDQVPVNIELDLYNLPCELLSIEIRNDLGLRVQNIEGNLTKYSINSKNEILGQKPYLLENLGRFGHDHDHIAQPDYELVKNQLKNKEGCRLKGNFFVDAVPGSFIISGKAFYPTIERLRREGLDTANLEHRINHLFFGQSLSKSELRFSILSTNLFNTLKDKIRRNEKNQMVYQYYLKIVPVKFRYENRKPDNKYQYTYNSFSDFVYNGIPSIYFKYDLSPITIEYKFSRMKFLTFLINIFAVLGGVFTVAGILDAIIHKSVLALLRKAEMNKIS
jgi:hypothetical protein